MKDFKRQAYQLAKQNYSGEQQPQQQKTTSR